MSQEKIDKFKKIGIDAILKDDTLKAEFGSLYYKLYNEKICVGCRGVIREKFNALINTKPEKLKIMSNRKFVMFADKLIDRSMAKKAPFGMYNAANITDEDAIALLKVAKGYIAFFKEYPKDWEKIAANAPAAKVANVKDPEPMPDAVEDRSDAIKAEGEIDGKPSTEMNAKDVIDFLERLDSVKFIETFTSGEADLPKPRKTVKKATKKRIRQLSE